MNAKLILTSLFILGASVASAVVPYVEGSIGYLLDSERPLYSGRVGFEVANTNQISHNIEAEIAHTSERELGLRLKLLPIMANYRFVAPMGPQTEFFGGGGLGITRAKISGLGLNASDEPFSAQAFVGMGYKITPTTSLTGAVRYLRIEKAEFFGFRDRVGDDFSLEVGVRCRF